MTFDEVSDRDLLLRVMLMRSRCSTTGMRRRCSGSFVGAPVTPRPRPTYRRGVRGRARGRRRYRSENPSAHAWLMAIASHKLNSALRARYAERRARLRLGMRPVAVTEDDLARIDRLADAAVVGRLLDELPSDQRVALVARVVDERSYEQIADGEGVSEAVVRKRVSRGLAGLRRRWEERA